VNTAAAAAAAAAATTTTTTTTNQQVTTITAAPLVISVSYLLCCELATIDFEFDTADLQSQVHNKKLSYCLETECEQCISL